MMLSCFNGGFMFLKKLAFLTVLVISGPFTISAMEWEEPKKNNQEEEKKSNQLAPFVAAQKREREELEVPRSPKRTKLNIPTEFQQLHPRVWELLPGIKNFKSFESNEIAKQALLFFTQCAERIVAKNYHNDYLHDFTNKEVAANVSYQTIENSNTNFLKRMLAYFKPVPLLAQVADLEINNQIIPGSVIAETLPDDFQGYINPQLKNDVLRELTALYYIDEKNVGIEKLDKRFDQFSHGWMFIPGSKYGMKDMYAHLNSNLTIEAEWQHGMGLSPDEIVVHDKDTNTFSFYKTSNNALIKEVECAGMPDTIFAKLLPNGCALYYEFEFSEGNSVMHCYRWDIKNRTIKNKRVLSFNGGLSSIGRRNIYQVNRTEDRHDKRILSYCIDNVALEVQYNIGFLRPTKNNSLALVLYDEYKEDKPPLKEIILKSSEELKNIICYKEELLSEKYALIFYYADFNKTIEAYPKEIIDLETGNVVTTIPEDVITSTYIMHGNNFIYLTYDKELLDSKVVLVPFIKVINLLDLTIDPMVIRLPSTAKKDMKQFVDLQDIYYSPHSALPLFLNSSIKMTCDDTKICLWNKSYCTPGSIDSICIDSFLLIQLFAHAHTTQEINFLHRMYSIIKTNENEEEHKIKYQLSPIEFGVLQHIIQRFVNDDSVKAAILVDQFIKSTGCVRPI